MRHPRRFLPSVALAGANAAVLMAARAFVHPSAEIRTPIVFLLLVSLHCIVESALVDEVPRGDRNLAGLASLTGLAIFGTFLAAMTSEAKTAIDPLLVATGLTLMMAGIGIRLSAIHTLGPRFVSELRLSDAEPLVRSGVYRWFAHPSELGLLALPLGAAVFFRSLPAGVIWAAIVLPVTLVRVRIENGFLRGVVSGTPHPPSAPSPPR